jgi:large subunit ribosomal protein L13
LFIGNSIGIFATPKNQVKVNTLSYKTVSANAATVNKRWYVVDASGKNLGRLASQIASVIRGKNKPDFTPHVDCGDNVIVINAEKVGVSDHKKENKTYITYSGYPGGQKSRTVGEMLAKKPNAVIEQAVKGMLPKNRLGRRIFHNLHVYTGENHPHAAQQPQTLSIDI